MPCLNTCWKLKYHLHQQAIKDPLSGEDSGSSEKLQGNCRAAEDLLNTRECFLKGFLSRERGAATVSLNSAPRTVTDVLQDTIPHGIMEEHMAVPAGKEPAQVPAARLTQPHDFQNMTQLVQQSLLHFVFMVPHTLQHRDNPLATLQKGTSRTRASFQTEMRSILSKRCWKSTT